MRSNTSVMPMLAVLYGSAFVAAFNENIINVALISIMGEFSVDATTAQWLVTGYMVITSIVVTITAFLSKRLRLKTLFLTAAILLAGGLIVDIVAPTFAVLLVARLVQSIGTGIFIPVMMSTVLAAAPRKRLGSYLSIGGCMITFGPAFAPVVSGLMVTSFGWRGVFVPPAVFVILLGVAGLFLIKNIAEPEKIKLDVLSVCLSALGLFTFVYGLSVILTDSTLSGLSIGIGIICIMGFTIRQFKVKNPLLNLSPMLNPLFAPVCVLVVVAMMTTFSMSVLLPLYFEGSLGTTAFVSGALLLPPILMNAITSLVGGRIMDKRGPWPLLPIGFALITVGQAAICLLAARMSLPIVLASSIVVYAGVGLVLSPSQTAGLQTLDREQNPHGVAIINTFVQVAASIGPSLFIGILSTVSASLEASGASAALAQAEGFSAAVTVAAVIAACGFGVSFAYALHRRKLANASQGPAASNEAAASPSTQELSVAAVMREPYLVPATATVREVMNQLVDRKTSGLPVVDEHGSIVGFVTDGDVLKVLGAQSPTPTDLSSTLALYHDMSTFESRFAQALDLDVMSIATTSIIAVDANTSIDKVCEVLSAKRIKKVPVLDGQRVVGTISRSDIVRHLMSSFAEASPQKN